MARHDREDPHSLEDQLAWLDAIKEMPDEVEIAVSAVTSASLAAATAPSSTEDEGSSPYPKDPWQSVPPDPASGPIFRNATDSAYGVPTVTVVNENADNKAARPADEVVGYERQEREHETFPGTPPAGLGRADDFPDTRPGSVAGADTISIPPGSLGRSDDFLGTRPVVLSAIDPFPAPPGSLGGTDTRSTPPGGLGRADDFPDAQPGSMGGTDAYSTPAFGRSAFTESPADTDSYNVGAFADSEARPSYPDPESGSTPAPAHPDEPVRGWLEPAIPVDSEESLASSQTAPQGDHVPLQPDPPPLQAEQAPPRSERPPAQAEQAPVQADRPPVQAERPPVQAERAPVQAERPPVQAERAPVQAERPPAQSEWASSSYGEERLGGSSQEGSTREEHKPYEREPYEREPAPVQEREQSHVQEREREPYQARRRQTPQAPVFNAPTRASGTKQSVDNLDPVSLLKGRRNAPSRGWRRFVYKASAGWIKPGEPPDVRRRRELLSRARTPVAAGHHRVAVLSLKGGVGKTTTTVGLGATLAQVRGDRVIAVDANPDRGTLSDKVELETSATVRDLLNERGQITRYVDIRAFTSQAPSRLEILASDRDPSVSEAFSASDYQTVSQVLENFYSICITDCGTGLLHSAMSGVLGLADQLVLVSSPSVDGARAASATLDWLEAHNYADLVKAATVVLCSVRPRSKSTVDLNRLEAHFAARCRAVVRVPYDPHLEEGAEIDLDRLMEPTREAYLRLAACIGDGFAGPQALGERRFSEIPDQI